MKNPILSAVAIAASMLVAPAAMAQTDYQLRAELRQINDAATALGRDNPGSAVVFAGCVAVAMDDYHRNGDAGQATSTLAGCATIGCAFTDSWKNCMAVDTQLLIYAMRASDIQQRLN